MLHNSIFMFSDMVCVMNTHVQPCPSAPHRPSQTVTVPSSPRYAWHRAALSWLCEHVWDGGVRRRGMAVMC